MHTKLFRSKYIKLLLVLMVSLLGYYALNRPWWWYSINSLLPVNATSAILIRESDFPWERRWISKQDVHQGMVWYQKIPGLGITYNPLSLGPDTVTLQFRNPNRGTSSDTKKFRSSDTFNLITTYNLKDGRELWSHKPPIQKYAAYFGGLKSLSSEHVLYAFSYDSAQKGKRTELTAFQRRSGNLLWKRKLSNQVYASLRGDSLHINETWTHSFYSNRGQLQLQYASADCYSGTGFWYISKPEGNLRNVKFKPFRDKVVARGWKPGLSRFAIRNCGEYNGRLFITHFKYLLDDLQISEISLTSGKQLRTRALESTKKPSKFALFRSTKGTRNNPQNGLYARYILLISRSGNKSLEGMFHVFDLQKFQVVATAKTTASSLDDRVIKQGTNYYIHGINGEPYLGVWNGETGRLEKAVGLDYFDMYRLSRAHFKDGTIWLRGGSGKFAVLDAKSLELLFSGGFNVEVKDVTEDMKKLTGLK